MTRHSVRVAHNFETAHRLPHLGGKCASLHGHSWWTQVTVSTPKLSPQGTVVEFGAYKALLRDWIDTNLDHGTMLGADDELVTPLQEAGCKLYLFAAGPVEWPGGSLAAGLAWPTVENVATLLSRVAARLLYTGLLSEPGATVTRVEVRETRVNTAIWEADR